MERKEFLEELKMLITAQRVQIRVIKSYDGYVSDRLKKKSEKLEKILDKLEQDYFHKPTVNVDIDLSNIKKFDEDGNLISEGEKEKSTTEQVEEGLLKIFNGLIESGQYSIGNYDFDNEKYSTSLCQIADRLLQIESDRKIRKGFFDNCVIS
ncbi:hypothetical protein [uncultured Clostridium sp.]|uniref:hypothetical protein n=1 Tax=uncultured Clostridium sp. TaxID=59620 RepID=UPI00258480E3|nr:hypothetical protein [uncultured Clostridium sp.]